MSIGPGLELLPIGGVIFFLLGLYWAYLSYRRYKTNLLVAQELQKIIDEAARGVHGKKRSSEMSSDKMGTADPGMFDSPELLSTIVTVLVNKFGDVRLSMTDFMISDDQYVSVYVDNSSQEILLSLNNGLSDEDHFIGFTKTDDQTFH
tara:strand:+ start:80 stop:523 length:444 start_codon:yes stop_codon:yes gene_type:complete